MLNMFRDRSLAPLVAVALTLVPAGAWADQFRCSFEPGRATFYIAPTVDLEVDSFGRVRVTDAIIASTNRQAVFGEVATNTSKRLSVMWEVPNVKGDPKESLFRDPHLIVRLTRQKASGAAVINVINAHARTASYRAEGRCEPVN